MDFNLIEILLAVGGTSGLTSILTLQIQRRKFKAEANQEQAKANQEDVKAKKDLADLERDIYTRIVGTMQNQFDQQAKQINELKVTIQVQTGNINYLQKTVDAYKKKCDNCYVSIAEGKIK